MKRLILIIILLCFVVGCTVTPSQNEMITQIEKDAKYLDQKMPAIIDKADIGDTKAGLYKDYIKNHCERCEKLKKSTENK